MPEQQRTLSLYRVAALFLRHRRIIVGVPLLAALVIVVLTLLKPKEWVTTSKVVVEGGQTESPLAGFAQQFGVRLPTTAGSASLDFYAELLKSPEVLAPLAARTFAGVTKGDSLTGSLAELYEVPFTSLADKVSASLGLLTDRVTTTTDPTTGVVDVRVKALSKELSATLNHAVIESANEFLLKRRQLRVGAEVTFIESRLTAAKKELAGAEGALRDFLTRNRQYQQAPQLRFQETQLQREVQVKQQVYTTLSQAYEQTRIEAVRNMPLLTVLQRPEFSVRTQAASLGRNLLLGLVLGVIVALTLVMIREYFERQTRDNPEDVKALRALWRTRNAATDSVVSSHR